MRGPETKSVIDSARDILVGKVPDPKSQFEQITIALIHEPFLRFPRTRGLVRRVPPPSAAHRAQSPILPFAHPRPAAYNRRSTAE